MSPHVIVEKRNTKMPHTRFPQWAQVLTAKKADCSLFSHRGKDQPPFLLPGQAVGRGPGRSLVASLAQSPYSSSLTASAEGLEGAWTPSPDSVHILQDFQLAGLCIGPGTPQEPVARRVTIRHLPVFQVGISPALTLGSAAPWP